MEKLLHYYQETLNDVKFQPNIYMYNALSTKIIEVMGALRLSKIFLRFVTK